MGWARIFVVSTISVEVLVLTGWKLLAPPDPMAILRVNRDTMIGLKTYQANALEESHYFSKAGKERAWFTWTHLLEAKPLLQHEERSAIPSRPDDPHRFVRKGRPLQILDCDGTHFFRQDDKEYEERDADSPEHMGYGSGGSFFTEKASPYASWSTPSEGWSQRITYEGRVVIDGVNCNRVRVHTWGTYLREPADEVFIYDFGQVDHLLRHKVVTMSDPSRKPSVTETTYYNIRLNEPINPSVFQYKPPPGVTKEKPFVKLPLLPNGAKAPSYTFKNASGGPINLSAYRGKVVLIDFWASWCGPCVASMPHTNEALTRAKNAGVPVLCLAIDDSESRDGFDDWVKAHKSTYPEMNFVYVDSKARMGETLFHVSVIPTQYVIDKNGVIRYSATGYDEHSNALEQELEQAGRAR